MVKLSMYVILLIALFGDNVVCFYTDYCDKNLCARSVDGQIEYRPNIGCNNDNTYASSCPSSANLQVLSKEVKAKILNLHNESRNKVALGKVRRYREASRMTTMHWDDELTYLAELNCLRCIYAHDECRNTAKYPHVGQNNAIVSSTAGYKNNTFVIDKFFRDWFNEYDKANMSVINAFDDQGAGFGHFTQVIGDKSEAIGCAIIDWSEPIKNHRHNKYTVYFVCNYSFTNFVGQPIYLSGAAGSKCHTGTNNKYSGMCNENELVDPIPYPKKTKSSSSSNTNSDELQKYRSLPVTEMPEEVAPTSVLTQIQSFKAVADISEKIEESSSVQSEVSVSLSVQAEVSYS